MNVKQIVLAARPKGLPTLDDFRFEEIELLGLKAGEVLLKGMYYSVDPYMRGRMNDAKSYASPFEVNKPIQGRVIAKVMESKSENFKQDDIVIGTLPWQEQIIANEKTLVKIDTSIAPSSNYLGILGMTGLTAYLGLMQIGKPKAGETLVVSGAAGAVGTIVGQIGKIMGCHVLGITGSDKKVKLLKKEFGFDAAVNYKTTVDMEKTIAKLCPNGVNIYFDNVGGEISDAVINNISFHARIPLCGQIALYNSTEIEMGPRLAPILLTRSGTMQGFLVNNYKNRFDEGIQQLAKWIEEGKLKSSETIIDGFDQLPSAFLGLFSGENIGKMIVKA